MAICGRDSESTEDAAAELSTAGGSARPVLGADEGTRMSGETVAHTIVTDRLRLVTGPKVPGIAIAIAGPEGLRETAAAGYADLAVGEPASAGMVCPWFSMTKIVTASLAWLRRFHLAPPCRLHVAPPGGTCDGSMWPRFKRQREEGPGQGRGHIKPTHGCR
jgi:Beta-lactamase